MSSPVNPEESLAAPVAQDMSRIVGDYVPPIYSPADNCIIGCSQCLTWLCFPCCVPCGLRIVSDYERAVRLRLGKRTHDGTLKGGLYMQYPFIDELYKVDLREQVLNIPVQSVITKEGLSILVDGVVYYRISKAENAILGVQNYNQATMMVAQTKLREVLGLKRFEEIQVQREKIAQKLQTLLDEATDPWGIYVSRVEITDIKLPEDVKRAMGSEAEAERNAKAKIIEAKGEAEASTIIAQAAEIMNRNPASMQLRYLQTIQQVSTENNSTIILPVPTEMLGAMARLANSLSNAETAETIVHHPVVIEK